jgi:tetratricopeptide (TPR) repeat protein
LVYKLKTLPDDTLLPVPPDKNLVAENEAFWAQAEKTALVPIEKALAPSESAATESFVETLFAHLHIEPEINQNDVVIRTFYSRSLNFWGVQLQRLGELKKAAARFETALKLNPDNIVAQKNLDFNQKLRDGQRPTVDLSTTTVDQLGKYNSWNEALNDNGPFDEPSFCFEDGFILARQNGFFRQAVAPFERVRELVPDYLPARYLLAQIYLLSRLPDRALDALREPLNDPEEFSLTPTNSTELNVLAAGAYFQENDVTQASKLLQLEISRNPTNDDLLAAAARAYLMHGLFTNALTVIDHSLKFAPDDPNWLYGRGYVCLQLKNYDGAITALSHVLSMQTTNNAARFNRAIAYLDSDRLDAARADFEKLQQLFTNSFQVAYGLGEIAYRQHETNEAIRNYEIYLANAKTNTAEATNVLQRLRELKK